MVEIVGFYISTVSWLICINFIGIVEIRPWKMVGAIGPRVYQSHQIDVKRKQLRPVTSIKYQYKYAIFQMKWKHLRIQNKDANTNTYLIPALFDAM